MTTLLSRAALAAAAMALGLSGAHATYQNSATANMNVSLSVTSPCTVTATNLSFGTSTLASNADATAAISVTCGSGTSYSVTLGDGQHSSTSGLRNLSGGGNLVAYYLYTDLARTNEWYGTIAQPGSGNGSAQSITVYGRVPATTGAASGSYSDIVQITVSY